MIDLQSHFMQQRNPRMITSEGVELGVKHVFLGSTKPRELQELSNLLENTSPELHKLYEQTNGAKLFSRVDDEDDCFYFLPFNEMNKEKKELETWMALGVEPEDYVEETGDDFPLTIHGIPPWWKSAVVFAGVGYAPERFYVAVEGEHSGKVFVFEHDGGCSELVCNRINDFFNLICQETAEFYDRYVSSTDDIVGYKFDAN